MPRICGKRRRAIHMRTWTIRCCSGFHEQRDAARRIESASRTYRRCSPNACPHERQQKLSKIFSSTTLPSCEPATPLTAAPASQPIGAPAMPPRTAPNGPTSIPTAAPTSAPPIALAAPLAAPATVPTVPPILLPYPSVSMCVDWQRGHVVAVKRCPVVRPDWFWSMCVIPQVEFIRLTVRKPSRKCDRCPITVSEYMAEIFFNRFGVGSSAESRQNSVSIDGRWVFCPSSAIICGLAMPVKRWNREQLWRTQIDIMPRRLPCALTPPNQRCVGRAG